MFYKASCLRRGLKTISAFNNCGDLALVATLLNLHDRQFNKAKALRKVMPMNRVAWLFHSTQILFRQKKQLRQERRKPNC